MAATSESFSSERAVDSQAQKSTVVEPARDPAETMTPETIKKKKKKKKKISVLVPEWYVHDVLSYKPEPLKEPEVPEFFIKKDPWLAASLYMMMADTALYEEYTKDKKLEEQRNFRHQLRTQDRVTREVEVDEDDDRYETAGGSTGGGRGRRRHRPGVMKKQDGQTRKLN